MGGGVPEAQVEVSVPVRGTCVTRNGESPVGRMTCTLKGGQADVRFVSERLSRLLHAGARVRACDMDAFCLAWLDARGRPPNALAAALSRARALADRLSKELDPL